MRPLESSYSPRVTPAAETVRRRAVRLRASGCGSDSPAGRRPSPTCGRAGRRRRCRSCAFGGSAPVMPRRAPAPGFRAPRPFARCAPGRRAAMRAQGISRSRRGSRRRAAPRSPRRRGRLRTWRPERRPASARSKAGCRGPGGAPCPRWARRAPAALVQAAHIPGRWAAPPAPAMMTAQAASRAPSWRRRRAGPACGGRRRRGASCAHRQARSNMSAAWRRVGQSRLAAHDRARPGRARSIAAKCSPITRCCPGSAGFQARRSRPSCMQLALLQAAASLKLVDRAAVSTRRAITVSRSRCSLRSLVQLPAAACPDRSAWPFHSTVIALYSVKRHDAARLTPIKCLARCWGGAASTVYASRWDAVAGRQPEHGGNRMSLQSHHRRSQGSVTLRSETRIADEDQRPRPDDATRWPASNSRNCD